MKITKKDLKRYWSKVLKTKTCWIWRGAKSQGRVRGGRGEWYGRVMFRSRSMVVHRVFFAAYKGKLKEGLEIDHLCRNTLCVNPKHLEAVTHSENVKRGTSWHHFVKAAKLITHCPQGHEYSEENTYKHDGQRFCKTCVRNRAREYQRKKSRERATATR